MTKSDLIEKVTASLEGNTYRKRDIERAVNVIFDSMKDALINEQRIEIRGLGSFKVRHRDARLGRNPKSGAGVNIPDRKIPFFRAGRELRNSLKNA